MALRENGVDRVRARAAWWKLPLLVAGLGLAACGGESESDGGKGEKTSSGLPRELRLTSLDEEKREVFCAWYDSVAPSEEACPRNTEEGEAPPTCLEKFEHFGTCTVEEVERCFASAAASACELPDTEACEAFRACQEEGVPANDCPDAGFVCTKLTWWGDSLTWGQCWSWWPMGCFSCDGEERTAAWAAAWCEQRHPEECKDKACTGLGDVLVD